MKPVIYIHVFAVMAIIALGLHLFSSFWIPLSLGALGVLALTWIMRK